MKPAHCVRNIRYMNQITTKKINLETKKDRIFTKKNSLQKFEFNDEVSQAFDDMASRSIPLYHLGQKNILAWAKEIYQKNTILYDIGCSTGTTIVELMTDLKENYHIIGIDSSLHMINQAQKKISAFEKRGHIELKNQYLEDATLQKSSVIILNYVLQFISLEKRLDILKKIYQSLNPNGALIISEKLSSVNTVINDYHKKIYMKFKKSQGYSQDEILRKKKSLEKVLIPISFEKMTALFKTAGFQSWTQIHSWNHFVSWVVIKGN